MQTIFFRTTKITWFSFFFLVGLNVLSVVIGMLLWSLDVYTYIFFFVPLGQAVWLAGLFSYIGVEVSTSGAGLVQGPNFVGWLLVIIGTLMTLVVYYIIASLIAMFFKRTKPPAKERM